MTIAERRRLTDVARGVVHADLYVRGGSLLNVYTGEVYPANVAAKGERIAYVGARDDMVGPRTRVVDATGRVLVPGYIDPHVHPATLTTPAGLARFVLPLGTTAIVADTLQFWELGGLAAFRTVADALLTSPLRFYWMIRPHAQSRAPGEWRRFGLKTLARALAHPRALAIGEVTRWPDAWRGDRELLRRLALARGGRVEGHTAGASGEKIAAIAAAGFTSDHEPITAQEVLDRARQGIAVMLRESSLRPDLVGLLDALKTAPALASRLMLTSDGSMPAFIRTHGFVDHLIRVALERGVTPVDAYRMATLNPATYYGLDADLGGVAPGRYADLCVLEDLAEPRPAAVIARGKVIAAGGRLLVRVPEPPWRRVFTSPEARLAVRWRARAGDFELPARARYPVIKLVSAVISQLEERPIAPGDLHAALLDRAGRWVAPGVVAGFAERLDGFATTTSTDFNILALGRRPEAMARAVNRLLDLHGGIVLVAGERIVYELPLPLGGIMTRSTLDEAARSEDELRRQLVERGYPHHEPLYTLFFLAADFLPTVRLSPRGVWDVKRSRVLLPSRRRR
ncbi:MAG TPA: adenine deaminase C-terminal domain-containing protein [Candidatus Binatia bacterium]|nr:adenine deaminase C-terminal domain-containing protein [Candidatus Binatia bacterium]